MSERTADQIKADLTGVSTELDKLLNAVQPAREFYGQSGQAGEGSPGETVFIKAYVRKVADHSNFVVDCAGESFNPSRQALADAEPDVADLPRLRSLVQVLRDKQDAAEAKARRVSQLQSKKASLEDELAAVGSAPAATPPVQT